MPHISRILVTSPRSRRTSRSVQLVREVVDAEVEAKVDAVADVNVDARGGAMIIRMGIEMIMGMVFKRGAMIGYAIAVVKSVDGILPTLLDFMLLGSVILALLSCQM